MDESLLDELFNELALFFDPIYVERGLNYLIQDRVGELRIAEDDPGILAVSAQVQGRQRHAYKVQAYLTFDENELLEAYGDCTCPVRRDCKHVIATCAAVLLQHMIKDNAVTNTANRAQEQLEWLHRRLQPCGIPEDTTPFIAWVLGQSHTGHWMLIPYLTQRNARQPERINKGRKLPMFHRTLTYLDEMLLDCRPAELLYHHEGMVPLSYIPATLLRDLTRSGRLWLEQDFNQPPVRWLDKKRPLPLEWNHQGQYWRLDIDEQAQDRQQAIRTPHYWLWLDAQAGTLQPLELPLPTWQMREILLETWHLPDQAELKRFSQLWQALWQGKLPSPENVYQPIEQGQPRLQIQLEADELQENFSLALLGWRYEDTLVPPNQSATALIETASGLVQRNTEVEKRQLERFEAACRQAQPPLQPISNSPVPQHWGYADIPGPDSLWHLKGFFNQHNEPLRSEGIDLIWPDHLPRLDEQAHIDAHLQADERPELFKLDLKLNVDGLSVPVTRVLAKLIERFPPGESMPPRLYLPVENPPGQPVWALIETDTIKPYLELLYSLQARGALEENGTAKAHALEIAAIDALDDALGEQRARETIRQLRQLQHQSPEQQPLRIPASFKAKLRPYQRNGVHWLQQLRAWRLNGILADDMGLGKTIQALAHLCIERAQGRLKQPALIVAPTSVISNWRTEANRFAPDLKVCLLQGAERHGHFDHLEQFDLVLTSYALILRDFDQLNRHHWSWLILDEAHMIKNPSAKTSRAVRQLKADQRLCLSGTPVENHLGELWALMDFLMPGLLGSLKHFNAFYRTPIEKRNDQNVRQMLQRKLAPLILRRTKQQVVTELPPKNEIIQRITLSDAERRLYDTVRLSVEKEVREALARQGLNKSRMHVLNALLKLRQICCDASLLPELPAGKPPRSSKLDALGEMVDEMIAEGRRILIFSQFTQMLGRIEKHLKSRRINTVKLTGRTRKRDAVINAFRRGDAPVFLISLKAGGVGLNLTEADTVILYDPWWNPAAENQAIDRAYRIGQDKTVFVYRLIADETIESRILDIHARKKALAQTITDTGEANAEQPAFRLDEQTIRQLLS